MNTKFIYGEVMFISLFLKEIHIILTLAVRSFDRKINPDKLLALV